MSELGDRLRELHASRKPMAGVHGQMLGSESYRIVATGYMCEWLIEAADKLDSLLDVPQRGPDET